MACFKNSPTYLIMLTFFLLPNPFAWADHPAQLPASVKVRYTGGYTINAEKMKTLNPGLLANRYGTLSLISKDGQPIRDPLTQSELVVRDQQYPLYDFEKSPLDRWSESRSKPSLGYGLRIIPAVNGEYVTLSEASTATIGKDGPNPQKVRGSELIDEYLRKVVYHYQGPDAETGPIFATIGYFHPEGFAGDAFSLTSEKYNKQEMGFTHMGAYVGNGVTVNSPAGYHGDTWWDDGQQNYPAMLSVLDFRGLAQRNQFDVRTFNENAIVTSLLLNSAFRGPEFPNEYDYEFDPVYSLTLETVFDYYARWLEEDPVLKADNAFKVYCAEHITQIINTMINLPQNLEGYQAVYGEKDGERLFGLALDALYRKRLRSPAGTWLRNVYLGDEKEFGDKKIGSTMTPYWKLLGHKGPVMKKNSETNRYEANDPKFKQVGYSLGWQPETVADLARDFVQEYLPWNRVGSLTSVAAILGFADQAQKRMNIPADEYVKKIAPVVQQIFLFEAASERGYAQLRGVTSETKLFAEFQTKRSQREEGLKNLLASIIFKLNPGAQPKVNDIAKTFMDLVSPGGSTGEDAGWVRTVDLTTATRVKRLPNSENKFMAYRKYVYEDFFQPTIRPLLEKLNELDPNPTQALTVKYYYSPGVHFRVGLGTHDAAARQNVGLWPTATIMQAREVLPLPSNKSVQINDQYFQELKVF